MNPNLFDNKSIKNIKLKHNKAFKLKYQLMLKRHIYMRQKF